MDELTDEEREKMLSTMSKVVALVADKVIETADELNVDRDSAMHYFANMMKMVVEVSTFNNWGGEGSDE